MKGQTATLTMERLHLGTDILCKITLCSVLGSTVPTAKEITDAKLIMCCKSHPCAQVRQGHV